METLNMSNVTPTKACIYHIFYDDATREENDKGFLPLDNLSNVRPDWREYWPIRNFLLGQTLDENTFYGFFSPKFHEKTTLDSATVYEFIASVGTNADVITFSPFFDQGAVFLNTFEQAARFHPGIEPVFDSLLALVAPGVNQHTLLMDSCRSIFCNYFVAVPAFWRRWFTICEMLFSAAEAGGTLLADQLNMPVYYENDVMSSKVFVIERMASLLLAIEPNWRTRNFDPVRLPLSNPSLNVLTNFFLKCDSLKRSAISTGN